MTRLACVAAAAVTLWLAASTSAPEVDAASGGDAGVAAADGGAEQGAQPKARAAEDGTKTPIDVPPKTLEWSGAPGGTLLPGRAAGSNEKLIIIGENFAPYSSSARYVTETDTIIVRFIVRKALACRVVARADSANKWEPSVFRFGGMNVEMPKLPASKFLLTIQPDGRSCDQPLVKVATDPVQFEPADGDGKTYVAVDFALGPFTDDQVAIHVYRFDRGFTGFDLEDTIRLPNHKRYSGWIDVAGGMNFYDNRTASIERDPNSGVGLVAIKNDASDIDFMALAKVYLACSGQGNSFGSRVDLQASTVCFGLGAGLSLRDPLTRFYPFGLNLTYGGSVSLHVLLSLNSVERASDSVTAGALAPDSEKDLPTTHAFEPGFALALGLDPGIFASLLKTIAGMK